ncbi:MAG: hypothetical protein L0214_07490 [candidate division NC10 bacterium]|nr:hypothetical protein [candidate division NC10 bacterium]
MKILTRDVLTRLPLAQAVLTTWPWRADDAFLEELFDQHRGRCYAKDLRFPDLVRLVHDVLAGAAPSAHQRFTQARGTGELPTTIQAA